MTRRRRLAHCLTAVAAAVAVLHAAAVTADHAWYATYGPLLALAAAAACAAIVLRTGPARSRWTWSTTGLAGGLAVTLVAIQRVAGEAAAGHGLAPAALAEHGWSARFVVGLVATTGLAYRLEQLHAAVFGRP